jgi:hypothetical protein
MNPFTKNCPRLDPSRVSDLTMITKIVAYVSKYEDTRAYLRQKYTLFSLIENLTLPAVIPEYWAGSCMRNAVKNSDSCPEKRCGLVTCHEEAQIDIVSVYHIEGTNLY